MAYDIIVSFSNRVVKTFKGITKIEYRDNGDYDNDDYDYDDEDYDDYDYDDEDYDDEDYKWIEIENPLEFKFDSYGDYRFSNSSKNIFVFTEDRCYIIFMEVTISNE